MTWGNVENNRGISQQLCVIRERRRQPYPNQRHLRVTVYTPQTEPPSEATSEAQTSGGWGGRTDFTKQENNNILARERQYPEVLQYIV